MGGDFAAQPQAPGFQSGTANFGDGSSSTTSLGSNGVTSQYSASPWEQSSRQWDQNQISQNQPGINTFDPATQQEFQDIAGAQRDNAMQQFQNEYQPQYQSMLNNINNRFGGLNNSALNDTMNTLSKNENASLAGIANDYEGNLQNIQNNALQQRYNYLNYLNGGLNNLNQDAYKAMGISNQDSQMGNSFNQGIYGTQAGMYNTGVSAGAQEYAANCKLIGQLAGGGSCGGGGGGGDASDAAAC